VTAQLDGLLGASGKHLQTQPTAVAFVADWIDCNVRPQAFVPDVARGIANCFQACLKAAAARGITEDDLEAATGLHPTELIVAAYLARWAPTEGHGGSA
jgi:hypothetical protein